MFITILALLASAAVIAFAGAQLIAAADDIANRLRWGRAFAGMIVVASITSLPEASTGISALALADAPDIAVGDIVGSCVFNLLLLAFADVASPGVAFYGRLRSSHNLTAAFSILLLAILASALLAPATARVSLGHVGIYSLLLAGLYFVAARLLFAVDVRATPTDDDAPPLRPAVTKCAWSGLAVIGAGIGLALNADRLVEQTGLAASAVGVLLVAAATSLPEVATTLAAVRMRAYDLAAGGLIGSNLFNMVVLAVEDASYPRGPLLALASPHLAISTVIAIGMTAIVVIALNYVRRTEPRPVDAWAGLALLALYVLNAIFMLNLRAPG